VADPVAAGFSPGFPLPDLDVDVAAPFWSAAAGGELRIPRCAGCGRWCWYPEPRCPGCGGADLPWTRVSGGGALFSWTVVHHPFLPQLADKVPLVTGLVALDEDPAVRLVTTIVDCDPAELAVGARMAVTFRPLSFTGVEGQVTAPMFTPAKEEP
jgi:uncharacterized protein